MSFFINPKFAVAVFIPADLPAIISRSSSPIYMILFTSNLSKSLAFSNISGEGLGLLTIFPVIKHEVLFFMLRPSIILLANL